MTEVSMLGICTPVSHLIQLTTESRYYVLQEWKRREFLTQLYNLFLVIGNGIIQYLIYIDPPCEVVV